jgi:hypothetical protein
VGDVATKIFRVVVRGHFHGLTDDQRAALLATAEDHEIFKARYTRDGSLTYEPNLVAFSFRYEVRVGDDDSDDPEHWATETAMEKATASLGAMGIGFRHLRATATDMASVWE